MTGTLRAELSVVADSTISSSLPPSPKSAMDAEDVEEHPPVRRAKVTYGRKRELASEDSDSDALDAPPSTFGSRYLTGPPDAEEEVPQTSPGRKPPSPLHESDADTDASPVASKAPQYSWRDQLQAIDDMDDDEFDSFNSKETSAKVATATAGIREGLIDYDGELPFVQPLSDLTSLPTEYSSPHHRTSTQSPPRDEDPPVSPLRRHVISPLDSPPKEPSIKRPSLAILSDLESDDDAPKESSKETASSSPTSPKHKHHITTPQQQSDTPPTSQTEQLPTKKSIQGAPRAASPSMVNEAPQYYEMDSPKRANKKSQKKLKAPTKKELKETALEQQRLLANQRVEVERVIVPHTHNISAFLGKIRSGSTALKPLQKNASSDPIATFSSSPAKRVVNTTGHIQSGPSNIKTDVFSAPRHASLAPAPKLAIGAGVVLEAAESDDDDMLPDIGDIMARSDADRKKEQEDQHRKEEARRLKVAKLSYLDKKAPALLQARDSEDDDDLVIESGMQSVAAEETADRKKRPRQSHGVEMQKRYGLVGKKAATTPNKKNSSGIAQVQGSFAAVLGSASKASPWKGKGKAGPVVTKEQLLKSLRTKAVAEGAEMDRKRAEDWYKGDRKRPKIPETSILVNADTNVDADEDEVGESDDEWVPEEERGKTGSQPQAEKEGDDDDADELEYSGSDKELSDDEAEAAVEHAVDEDMDDQSSQSQVPRRPGRKHRPTVTFESDDEAENQPVASMDASPMGPSLRHRGSLSSETQTEEGDDNKENDAKRMFDRSEDKENVAVVRHGPSPASAQRSPLTRRHSSLHGLEDRVRLSLGTSSTPTTKDEERTPFKVLDPGDDMEGDDPFLTSSARREQNPFVARLQSASNRARPSLSPVEKQAAGPSALAPAPMMLGGGFSQFSDDENDENEAPAPKRLRLSGLDDAFDDATQTAPRFRQAYGNAASIPLTLDPGLRPALEVSATLQRQAEVIFEKEQEYLLDAANQRLKQAPELYVNEHGFLTQTRPGASTPEMYRSHLANATQVTTVPSSTRPSTFTGTASRRTPLRTLSESLQAVQTTLSSPEIIGERRLMRLRRQHNSPGSPPPRATSPHESNTSPREGPKNALDFMMQQQKRLEKKRAAKAERRRLRELGEYVMGEAEESSDEENRGFGKKDSDDEDDDDSDDDAVVEGLVDDQHMSDDEIAKEAVMEKVAEQAKEDDEQREKEAKNIVDGKWKNKRKRNGFIDDSDEEEDDEDYHRKKRAPLVDSMTIKELLKEDGNLPFVKSYRAMLPEDEVFDGEREVTSFDVDYDMVEAQGVEAEREHGMEVDEDGEQHDDKDEEPFEPEKVDIHQLRREIQERAKRGELPTETFNPEDLSWLDREDDIALVNDDGSEPFRLREFKRPQPKPTAGRTIVDFDDPSFRRRLTGTSDGSSSSADAKQLQWARNEQRSMRTAGTGRGAAVTGHAGKAKVRSGGGSLRPGLGLKGSSGLGASAPGGSDAAPKPKVLRKEVSVLSKIGDSRSRFTS